MTSRPSPDFRRDFAGLPEQVKRQAREAYRLFKANAQHPGLKFKKLLPHNDIWSIRINNSYRAVGRWKGDVIVRFFIGLHGDYDKLLDRL